MRAGLIREHGNIEKIQIDDVDIPQIGSNEILVKTKYAALNHLDLFVVQGWTGLTLNMPHILGSDGSGIVESIGDNIQGIQKGDYVTINPGIGCGKCNFCLTGNQNYCTQFSIMGENRNGTYASYFKVPSSNIFKLPNEFPLDIAAAAPLTFLTAWRMLVTQAQIKMGDIVLIQGGSGGVATAALQIAKLFQAKVIVTTSSFDKSALIQNLGADHIINYRENPDYLKYIYKDLTNKQGIDIVVDSVGTKTFSNSLKLLKTGGKLVTCGATTGPNTNLDIRQIFWKQLHIIGSTMSNHAEFHNVMQHILSGKLKPIIDKVFSLDQLREAETYLHEGKQFGKVILKL